MTPLPTDPRPAIEAIASYVRGDLADVLEVLHAGWDLAGYSLRQFHDHPTVFGATKEFANGHECAKHILAEVGYKEGRGAGEYSAINWTAIIPLVLQLIQMLLAGKS